MNDQERVVVTGIGLVTPVGIGKENVWSNLIGGVHGFAEVQSMDTSEYRVHRGAEVKDFDFDAFFPDLAEEFVGKTTQFALVAAKLALGDADLPETLMKQVKSGVAMGTTSGEPNQIERFNDFRIGHQWEGLGAEYMSIYPCHSIPARLAREFGATDTAPVMLPAACAAGNYAIGYASECIQSGKAQVMLAGGADSFSRITYTGFSRLLAIAPEICQPFDQNRRGMIPGEGAGVLVLESLKHAKARGATIYAEVAACGLSCDAYHMTGSHADGKGAIRAMQRALEDSGLLPHEISYLCAHGTGTKSNDLHESRAIQSLFGESAKAVPISSIKSMLGHTMGAASAIEAGVCALAIERKSIPPTAHLETPDPEFDLDYVAGTVRSLDVISAMSNAYAFGGSNASLILKSYPVPDTNGDVVEAGSVPVKSSKRVVVTGIGGISALGDNAETIFESICSGRTAFAQMEFPEDYPELNLWASQLHDFDPKPYLGDHNYRPLDRTARLALVAADQAIQASDWSRERLSEREVGLTLGTQFGSIHSISQFDYNAQTAGVRYAKPLDFANTVINAATGQLAIWFGLSGANTTISSSYISGSQACLHGYQVISSGKEAQVLTGGAEELSCPAMLGYSRMNLLVEGSDEISLFDDDRSGFLMGEGAFFLMLEELSGSSERDCEVYGEILGGASGYDPSSGQDHRSFVDSIAKTIQYALKSAEISPAKIDFIYANLNGHSPLDRVELDALSRVFSDSGAPVPVSAIKGMTGELLGASGSLQVMCALLSLKTGKVPGSGKSHVPINVPPSLCMVAETTNIEAKRGLVLTLGVDGFVSVVLVGKL